MRYFKKIYPRQPLILSNGGGFSFPILENGEGAIATENPKLLKEFDLAISKKIGGVSEISKVDFDELKKKASAPSHREGVSLAQIKTIRLAADRAAAERAAKPTQFTPQSRALNKPGARLNSKGFKPATVDRP